jgi:hypothetical protein
MRDPKLPRPWRFISLSLVLVSVISSGCSAVSSGQGSCVFTASFRGAVYRGNTPVVFPEPGEVLGEAVVPGCGSGEPGWRMTVSRLPGIDPGDALVGEDGWILIREGLEPLPPEIERFFQPPACDPADEPIDLRGTWLGILGADGKTELDMAPPYDVEVRVREASSPRYERADLEVRVPRSLGEPLTRKDIRSSLWKGGDIAVTAVCSGDRLVAQRVEAFPG